MIDLILIVKSNQQFYRRKKEKKNEPLLSSTLFLRDKKKTCRNLRLARSTKLSAVNTYQPIIYAMDSFSRASQQNSLAGQD